MGQRGDGGRHVEGGPGLVGRQELGAVGNSLVLLLSGCGVGAMGSEGWSSHREGGQLWWCGGDRGNGGEEQA